MPQYLLGQQETLEIHLIMSTLKKIGQMKAEQAVWDLVKILDESKRFELAVVNPDSTFKVPKSVLVVERFLRNSIYTVAYSMVPCMPALPDISISVVAMENSNTNSNRYIPYNNKYKKQLNKIEG